MAQCENAIDRVWVGSRTTNFIIIHGACSKAGCKYSPTSTAS
jgi:hypothetical protein